MNKPIYVHYGHEKFDDEKFNMHHITLSSKPDSGLWASRIDAPYGWKDWCDDEQYRECTEDNSFKFYLKDTAKILKVSSLADIEMYANDPYGYCGTIYFQMLKTEGYDGIELFISDNFAELHNGIFNTWDCDSIVVWNKDVIELI